MVKTCAKAGKGQFTFIKKSQDINSGVIETLNKDFYEYLTVKKIRVFDDKTNVYRYLTSH